VNEDVHFALIIIFKCNEVTAKTAVS